MADKKLTALTAITTPTDDDLMYVVDAPGTTPASYKITWANIKATLKTYFDTLYTPVVTTIPNNGWIASSATWAYSSADSPTFVITINADMTALIGVGYRIKLTQTTVKYFIVTAVGAYSGGNTLVTVYGGTDYTLANAAISLPYFTPVKAPLGFPVSPAKWTVSLADTTNASQASPTSGTFYNLGSLSISIPIGAWLTEYSLGMSMVVTTTATRSLALVAALSTSNNSVSDNALRMSQQIPSPTGTAVTIYLEMARQKTIVVTSKTTYYLVGMASVTTDAITSVAFRGDTNTTVVNLVCAYL